ncbi:UDP-Glycosyltransferase superfamily protein [Rhynchospora pubera]|uniref:UDP-Glycosyltransferase superfamily protein n=1 Tax=Rhynchospora pubera TaxID=906938 RepID=A0AAV8CZC5_9POAL|nr:UDP-Glycosyltransferase superfamily protein [Rhynchospora pubera]
MASANSTSTSKLIVIQRLCFILFAFSILSCLSFIYWPFHCNSTSCNPNACIHTSFSLTSPLENHHPVDLLSFPSSWNHLSFPSKPPPPKTLKIALFVKRWPRRTLAGGLERHALTLHLALAKRGHQVHIFTTNSPNETFNNMFFHVTPPTKAGYINQPLAWEQFRILNSDNPFDVIHTESVALYHARARNFSNLVVSWHGIAYETIHSDIVQDMLRAPDEHRQKAINERIGKVIDEVKFFQDYAHHVATSDHVGDVLRRVYMVREDRVHVIVNGVDDRVYKLDVPRGMEYRERIGVPQNAALVFGLAGRLVKDKGHPLMFEAIKQLYEESVSFKNSVVFLVAGDGPWASRYSELWPNVVVLGPLEQSELASFYNSLDVFINPTLRAQGLDHTIIEAMMSGVAVAATRFASITGSLIVGPEAGYTFLPTVDSLKRCLYRIWEDGKVTIKKKGEFARGRAARLFTANKMALAYEKLFLCVASQNETKNENNYCKYQGMR